MARRISKQPEITLPTETKEQKEARARVLSGPIFTQKGEDYEVSDKFIQASGDNDIHTVHELVEGLKRNKNWDIDARILSMENETGRIFKTRVNKEQFLNKFAENTKRAQLVEKSFKRKYKESWDNDWAFGGYMGDAIGQDFTPLLGGPFNKQLYIYDYLRMHTAAFFAYNHCPFSKATVEMTRNFTMGRGFRVDIDNPKALALWRAFEDVNQYEEHMDMFAQELSEYGESMTWFLPNNQIYNYYGRKDVMDKMPKGLIPRIRLLDPSTCWEITTLPEDITRVISYTLNFPTQYQIYTGKDPATKERVPTAKFIFQQLPANEVIHTKINCASDEKRGRSDLFPVLGYSKRIRDSINYQIVALQKAAAWAIDTEVDGDQTDIDNYLQSIAAYSGIVPAGSEFVHSKYVKRNYVGLQGGKSGGNTAFDWCLSAFASGVGFPLSYYATHMTGGNTRGGAVVASEPVAKKLENRQRVYERKIKKDIAKYFEIIGFTENYEVEVSFPEIITQDRSKKLQDIDLAKTAKYISQERAANLVAKELGITEFDFVKELEDIQKEEAMGIDQPIAPLQDELVQDAPDSTHGMAGDERNAAKQHGLTKN